MSLPNLITKSIVFLLSLLISAIGMMMILPLGLGTSEKIVFPLTLGVVAVLAAVSVNWVSRLFLKRASIRLLPVFGVALAAAFIMFTLISLFLGSRLGLLSLLVPFGASTIIIVLSANMAAWRFRSSARAWRKEALITASLLTLTAAAVLFSIGILPAALNPCSAEEKAVLAEFPQYGNLPMKPATGPHGECSVRYKTPDPPDKVMGYFVENLRSRGWRVQPTPRWSFEQQGGSLGGTLLLAWRDGFVYQVHYERLSFYNDVDETMKGGTHIVVYVSKQ